MKSELSEEELLNVLFNSLLPILSNIEFYALKGGYVVSNFISKDMRKTTDIDMSINSIETFNAIQKDLTPILDELKEKGEIFNYKFSTPKVTKEKNVSGGVKLYRQPLENKPKRVVCGIDISIHDVSFGTIKSKLGVNIFSVNRMLADKVSILYKDTSTIIRRIRDLYDIYIFNVLNCTIDVEELSKCLAYRNIDYNEISVFESADKKSKVEIYEAVKVLLLNSRKVNIKYIQENNVTAKDIIESVIFTLDFIRRNLC